MDRRYAFKYNNDYIQSMIDEYSDLNNFPAFTVDADAEYYDGGTWRGEVRDILYADVVAENPPQDWIEKEEILKIGKIVEVAVNICKVGDE